MYCVVRKVVSKEPLINQVLTRELSLSKPLSLILYTIKKEKQKDEN